MRLFWGLQSAIAAGAVAGGVLLLTLVTDLPRVSALAAFVAVLVIGVLFAVARYRRWRFEVREDDLYLERGVITHVTTVVPFVRVQHVDARRSAIERTLGLASTVVYTAGSRGADVRIPGLTPERAAGLQDELRELAIEAGDDDAV